MSKRHFLLYDFLLPLLGIIALGRFLSSEFDNSLFRWLDQMKAFGFGAWFIASPVRPFLWGYVWTLFCIPPALLWITWIRINLEYDWVNRKSRMDRPLFTFFRGLARWIEGHNARAIRQAYEQRLAQADDRIRQLQTALQKSRQPQHAPRREFLELEDDPRDRQLQVQSARTEVIDPGEIYKPRRR